MASRVRCVITSPRPTSARSSPLPATLSPTRRTTSTVPITKTPRSSPSRWRTPSASHRSWPPAHQCQSVRQLPQHPAARLRQCWQPVEGEFRAEHPSRVDQLCHLDAQGVRPSTSPRRTDTGPLCAPIAAARRGHIRLTRSSHPGRWGLERRCRDARQVTGTVEDDCPWRLGGVVRCLGAWLSREAHHDKVSMAIQRRCASVSASV
jgi:hypothetical protein